MRIARFLLPVLLLLAEHARAGLSFVLTSPAQIGTATNDIVFRGALTNTGSEALFLNDIHCSWLSVSNTLRADTNAFFANVPGILLPGESYTDIVFGVTLGPVAPPGLYAGTAALFGGGDIFAASNLASASFQVSLPDSVGDGIPDWWRQIYFGGDGAVSNSQSCAACDADGTGQNNWFKYVVGLNPTNPASRFVLSLTNASPPEITLGPIAAGRQFRLQSSDDLSSRQWKAVTVDLSVPTNQSQFLLTDPAPSASNRFYRVLIQLP